MYRKMSPTTSSQLGRRRSTRRVAFPGVDQDIPGLRIQFFYSSKLCIDDPLATIPAIGSSDAKTTKFPFQPFTGPDNEALEEAWLSLSSKKDGWEPNVDKAGKAIMAAQGGLVDALHSSKESSQKKSHGLKGTGPKIADALTITSRNGASQAQGGANNPGRTEQQDNALDVDVEMDDHLARANEDIEVAVENTVCCPGLVPSKTATIVKLGAATEPQTVLIEPQSSKGKGAKLRSKVVSKSKEMAAGLEGNVTHLTKDDPVADAIIIENQEGVVAQVEARESGDKAVVVVEYATPGDSSAHGPADRGYFTKIFKRSKSRETSSAQQSPAIDSADPSDSPDKSLAAPANTPAIEIPKTKRLDIRKEKSLDKIFSSSAPAITHANDVGTSGQPFLKLPSRQSSPAPQSSGAAANQHTAAECELVSSTSHTRENTEEQPVYGCKAHKKVKVNVNVLVGVSRLHEVKVPDLQLTPIYWSPVHDTAVVTRGTWFYKDTMFPVEPAVANQLEMGYRQLRPWSQTWNDELQSALDVGAIAEEKVAHRLWPPEEYLKKDAHKHNVLSIDAYCAASCFHGEVAAEGSEDVEESFAANKIAKKYPNSQVIFKDARHAFILKPSLQPSAYHGRRPVHKILKGNVVGIPVVRGFDWHAWKKLHSSKPSSASLKADEKAAVGGDPVKAPNKSVRTGYASKEDRIKPTDLILVIHGIGQKLSERVESFHFTHAINSLRRSIHLELANPAIQKVVRKDLGGMMILPVNWRSSLTFDEDHKDQEIRDFSLKDITPDTIPAVRNLISDVMFDIPFYMSNHKPKIIEAVVTEANRVYRLWCKNNPGFEKQGRVHIVAHSLGCALALEVLSRQPTLLPKTDLTSKRINKKFFDFKTTNVFFAGSPAGFFLFLEGSQLVPRKNQRKPGAEHGDDERAGVVGEVDQLGCMAVDNFYNIMHYNDPIAYRMNAAVDKMYADSLKIAQLPNTSIGFIETLVKAITPGSGSNDGLVGTQLPRSVARLPSQLEMEVHDFSREEVAEKKFYLLNDNGQVDWYTNAGSGMLDNQYINMLGAHSSYWTSLDFIRLIVTECGRKPGRGNAVANMKAAKVGHKK